MQKLPDQRLRDGLLDINSIEWQLVTERKSSFFAARVPSDRLPDFQGGEGVRGGTTVQLHTFQATDGVPVNMRALCQYGELKKAHHVVRTQALPTGKPLPLAPGTAPRRTALQKGTSIKLACAYTFCAKQYSKLPGNIVLKFPYAPQDTAGTCRSMQHCTTNGCPAHEGDERHALHYTAETDAFVVDRLKASVQPKVIRAGAP